MAEPFHQYHTELIQAIIDAGGGLRELGLFSWLHARADLKTAIVRTNAADIAHETGAAYENVKSARKWLREKNFVLYLPSSSHRKCVHWLPRFCLAMQPAMITRSVEELIIMSHNGKLGPGAGPGRGPGDNNKSATNCENVKNIISELIEKHSSSWVSHSLRVYAKLRDDDPMGFRYSKRCLEIAENENLGPGHGPGEDTKRIPEQQRIKIENILDKTRKEFLF